MPTVLCDSGPLIALAKVGRLRLLLDLWGVVHTTAEVYEEAVTFGHAMGAPDALTIRLFCQKHNLPIITAAEDVFAAYHPPIKVDPGEHAIFAHARTLKMFWYSSMTKTPGPRAVASESPCAALWEYWSRLTAVPSSSCQKSSSS